MDSAGDGSNPDNCDDNYIIYIKFRHGLHYSLC